MMMRKFNSFRGRGMRLAVDDFGSGYSNEMLLLAINPEYVKLDISLIQNIHLDLNKQQLASNIISYARPRGIRVIAEGVETFEEASMAIRLGADYLQGYYMGQPSYELEDVPEEIKSALKAISTKYRDRRSSGGRREFI